VKDIFPIEGDASIGLAIVTRPRGEDWLEEELRRMQRSGIQVLVSMLEEDEAASLGLSDERKLSEENGLGFLSFSIPDRTIPMDTALFRAFAAGLAKRLKAGERIGIHCRGSIGRASIAAACALVHLGWSAEKALSAIETARGCAVPDTDEQRQWILRYETKP
jgi:protein-tyrosine phosphatase